MTWSRPDDIHIETDIDFSPTEMKEVEVSEEPRQVSLSDVIARSKHQDAQEKVASFKLDGEISSQDVMDLALTVEKIGNAISHRLDGDDLFVKRLVDGIAKEREI